MPTPHLTVIAGGRANADASAETRTFKYPPEWSERTCAGCGAPMVGPRRPLVEAVTVTNFLNGLVEYWHGLCRTVHETRTMNDGCHRLAELIARGGEDTDLGLA